MAWWAGDRAAAERAAKEAIAVLEPAGDRRLLALALSNQSQLHMLASRAGDCVTVGERAIALARELGDAAILSHALTNVGGARWQLGEESAWSLMEESLRVALAAGEVEHACRSYAVLAWHQLDDLRLDAAARKRAADAGMADRVSFEVASAQTFGGGAYDLVTTFDCLHDMGDPLGAACHIREALTPDGTWMVVEPAAGVSLTDNLNPVGRTYYSFSTFLCVPNALSQAGGYSLGAQAGQEPIRRLATDAGFSGFRRVAETPFNLVYEARP
jgi:hypothetical protein